MKAALVAVMQVASGSPADTFEMVRNLVDMIVLTVTCLNPFHFTTSITHNFNVGVGYAHTIVSTFLRGV